MSAVEVLDRMVNALGGAERLRAFHSAEESIDFSFPDGAVISAKVYWKAPNLFRTAATFGDTTLVQIYDGKEGFSFSQYADGERTPIPLSADQIEDLRGGAENYGFGRYLDPAAWGYTVRCLRIESEGGREEIVLEWQAASGARRIEYVDTGSWLTNRVTTVVLTDGTSTTMEFAISNYESVDGVVRPFRTEARESGSTEQEPSMIFLTRKLAVDPELPEGLFSREGMPRRSTESSRTEVGA